MQALSQLSYGPTVVLRAAYHSGGCAGWEEAHETKSPDRSQGCLLEAGVPTGIRTPVATVKG